ncbi:putative transcription factor WD40-like family [Rosa chinensis]|uniref:Putative transcription factor WD40-like family n=1 Tax=Rosa chinensis TaxID=74649 RepID=A0A2P6QT58_ROSCH|nr:WD repeat-containing protein 75 isoform X2 [Rosa chinensis]PRQ37349.1 putative transcription factor WD40-like family [Rosa chinensis]
MIGGGKSYVSAPPAFSNDAKRLLVCTGTAVSVFSTSTGLQILSLEGHTALVTAVIVVPGNKALSFCWTASLDGTVRYWDFAAAELMKTIDIKMPIYSMVIPALLLGQTDSKVMPADAFAYLSVENTTQDNAPKALRGQIRKCSLTESRLAGVILAETRKPEVISISPSGKFFGIRNKRKLHIWRAPAKDSKLPVAKITLHHTRNFTLLALHPTKRLVAAGDTSGRILIWRGFGNRKFSDGDKLVNQGSMNDEEGRPGIRGDDDADSCTTWHWHPTGINLLRFSSDGAYLYSGGKEGVLVDWQLDTGKKKFLPRIGSPLLYLTDSLDPSLSALSCADNQIHLLKMPSMEITKSISGIKLPFSSPDVYEGICSKFAFDDTDGLVALRTENYRIQFYSLFDDREISEVQVCERNHQPGDEVSVIVTLVSLSGDGSMMSTVEVNLPEDGIGGLVCLKFWASDSQNKNFNLSTIVYQPHRDAGVSALAFHPTRQMVVSSSYGGDFKIWVCSDEIQQKQDTLQHSGWMCYAVGSYKKKPMTAAAFSADGSVLAVAAETVITLWDPVNNMLVAVLGEMQMPIVTLSFAGNSDYLLSISRGSKPQLSVWSMSKLSESWSYKLDIEDVTCAKDSSSFAVLAHLPKSSTFMGSNEPIFQGKDGVILLFNATDPVPLAMWSVRKAKGGGLAFLKGNSFQQQSIADGKSPQALLAYINADHEYILFDPYDYDARELRMTRGKDRVAVDETARYGYASIYGELPQFEMKRDQTLLAPYAPSQRPWETIFSGSSHNLLPLPKLCLEFMESLLERRTTTVE